MESGKYEDLTKESMDSDSVRPESQTVIVGITCCVPECFRNSLRNPELSFHVISSGKRKEKQDLRACLHEVSQPASRGKSLQESRTLLSGILRNLSESFEKFFEKFNNLKHCHEFLH